MLTDIAVIYDYHPRELLATRVGKLLESSVHRGIDVYRYDSEQDKEREYNWWTPNLRRFRQKINSKKDYRFNVVLHSDNDHGPKLLVIPYGKQDKNETIRQISSVYDLLQAMRLDGRGISVAPTIDQASVKFLPKGPGLIDFELNEGKIKNPKEGYKLTTIGLYLLQHI